MPQEKPKTAQSTSKPTKNAIETAGSAILAIFFKYFQVVDLLMNFFSKINLEVGEDLQEKLTILRNAELPNIGFLES